MDSRIAPTDRLGSAILAALQAQQGDAQVQALLAFVGESLDLVLLTQEGGKARLQMPSGQVIEAKGELPYPPGTRLTVQVQPPGADQVAPRLKLVEAVPPAPLPILAPLQQGEALQLLARLTVPDTPPELAALARLFAALEAGGREAASGKPDAGRAEVPKPSPAGPVAESKPAPTQAAPPSAERIVAALKELPPAVLRDLQRILFPAASRPPSLVEMAETLRLVLQTVEAGGPGPENRRSPARAAQPERSGPAIKTRGLAAVPVASARSSQSPAAAAQELLRQFRPALIEAVTATPSGNADPALEPLKDFLLLLLKSGQQDSPSGPDPRANLDPSPAAARPAIAKPPEAPKTDPPAAPKQAAPLQAAPEPAAPLQAAPEPAAPLQAAPEPAAPLQAAAPEAPQSKRSASAPIVEILQELPAAVLRDLQRILFPAASKSPTLPETAEALRALLETADPGPSGGEAARQLLKILQEAMPAPGGPPGTADPIMESLKTLLRLLPKTPSAAADPQAAPAPDEASPAKAPPRPSAPEPTSTRAAIPAATVADPLEGATGPRPSEPTAGSRMAALLKELPPAILQDLQRIFSAAAPGRVSLPEMAEILRLLLEAKGAAEFVHGKDGTSPPAATAPLTPGSGDAPPASATPPGIGETDPAPLPTASPGLQEQAAAAAPDSADAPPEIAGRPLPALNEAVLKLLQSLQEAMSLPAPTAASADTDPALGPLKNLLQFLLESSGPSTSRVLIDLLAGGKAFGPEPTAAIDLSGPVPAAADKPGLPVLSAGQNEAAAQESVTPVAVEPASGPLGTPAQSPAVLRRAEPLPAQPALPSTGRIVAMLRELPPALLQDFQRILFPGAPKPPSLPEMAEALRGILQAMGETPPPNSSNPAPPTGSPSGPPPPAIPQPSSGTDPVLAAGSKLAASKDPPPASGQGKPAVALPPSLKDLPMAATGRPETGSAELSAEILRRVQQTLASPVQPLPLMVFQGGGDPALEPLKNLLMFLLRPTFAAETAGPALADLLTRAAAQPPPDTATATRPGAGQPASPEPGPVLESGPKSQAANVRHGDLPKAILTPSPHAAERAPAAARPQDPPAAWRPAAAESPALAAKSWESWLSEGVRTLSDPRSSPREAPFHLAQAREGTAFFELPLPWEGQGKVLQMWVESDSESGSRGHGEKTRRVLVGLHFSSLGETRVGIVQAGDRLQIKVWAEHPEILRSREDAIRAGLADLGPDLDFQVLPLGEPGEGVPSLRALVAGTGFHALG